MMIQTKMTSEELVVLCFLVLFRSMRLKYAMFLFLDELRNVNVLLNLFYCFRNGASSLEDLKYNP